jgi:hypothetical protein
VTALVLAFVPNALRQVRAANYVETAVTTHRSYLDGHLALGIRSDSAAEVTSWFTGKVPFQFRLPQSREGGVPIYQLAGASLVSYRGIPAALLIYEKQRERISLLVASSQAAVVAGGEEVRFGALMFHYRIEQGFKVVTWSNHGLSYALVSSVSGSGRESCMICHQSMADRQTFPSDGRQPLTGALCFLPLAGAGCPPLISLVSNLKRLAHFAFDRGHIGSRDECTFGHAAGQI